MNLLNVSWIRSLLTSRWFPIIPQLIMLVIFALLIAGGIGVTTDDAAFAKILRNTNLASLLVWSYWWPLVIVAAIFLGRAWCTVCPMELLTSLASRMGLRRKIPRFLKSGWVITIFYAIILIVGVHTLAIHRIPHRMALYLLTLMGASILVGLIYEKRAFCSYVCPVGHLIGLYALISPFEWRADDLSVCKECKSKDCIEKDKHYKIVDGLLRKRAYLLNWRARDHPHKHLYLLHLPHSQGYSSHFHSMYSSRYRYFRIRLGDQNRIRIWFRQRKFQGLVHYKNC